MSCLAVHFIGGDNLVHAQAFQTKHTYEAVVENNVSKVLTTLVIKAYTKSEAESQIALNGWRVVEIRQVDKEVTQEIPLNTDSIVTDIPSSYTPASVFEEVGGTKPPIDNASWFDANSHLDLTPTSKDLIKLDTIYFNHASIAPRQSNALVRLQDLDKTKRYVVLGHTDSQAVTAPTEAFTDNFDLSYKRAESVKQAMVDLGIPSDNIKTVGLGDRYLAVETADKNNAANRRAEIYGLSAGE